MSHQFYLNELINEKSFYEESVLTNPILKKIFNQTKNVSVETKTQEYAISPETLKTFGDEQFLLISAFCYEKVIDAAIPQNTYINENGDTIVEDSLIIKTAPVLDSDYDCKIKVYSFDKTELLFESDYKKDNYTEDKISFKISDIKEKGIYVESYECFSMAPVSINDVTPTFIKREVVEVGGSSAKILLNINQDSTVFYKVVSESEEPVENIENIDDSEITLIKDIDTILEIKNLAEKTKYTIYFIAQDNTGVQEFLSFLNFETTDSTPATLTYEVTDITSYEAKINVSLSEKNTKLYCALIEGECALPTTEDLKNYIFSESVLPKLFLYKTINLESENGIIFDNLNSENKFKPKTKYNMFVCVVDSNNNTQPEVYSINFETKSLGKVPNPVINFTNKAIIQSKKEINISNILENSTIHYKLEEYLGTPVNDFSTFDKNILIENNSSNGSKKTYSLKTYATAIGYDDSDTLSYELTLLSSVLIDKIKPTITFNQNKNIISFQTNKIELVKKYILFNFVNNMYVKLIESENENFVFNANYETDYNFCICATNGDLNSQFSDIIKITTPKKEVVIPYGKQHYWPLTKNQKDIISKFDFIIEAAKFSKRNYEYFLLCNKKITAICSKKTNPFYSFTLLFNIVFYNFGINEKIITNESEEGTGWSVVNDCNYIFLQYNGNIVTKKVKIPKDERIEIAIEFNRNKQIVFYINQECMKNTKQIADLVLNENEILKIGSPNIKFLINEMSLYKGIFTSSVLPNPKVLSIKNIKNKNVITFVDVADADEYIILRSESKYGKYNEIGRVEKITE